MFGVAFTIFMFGTLVPVVCWLYGRWSLALSLLITSWDVRRCAIVLGKGPKISSQVDCLV